MGRFVSTWIGVVLLATQQAALSEGTALLAADAGPDVTAEPLFAVPTLEDRIGRIMAPVYINGQGPFSFLVDTGATHSVIAPRVVSALGLSPSALPTMTLHGVTGSEDVTSIQIDSLRAGAIVVRNRSLPVVTSHVFANADGILGMEVFDRMCLHADFADDRISITEDRCPRLARGWNRIPVSRKIGGLISVNAKFRSVKVRAIIDTGAARSLGNLALLRALSMERRAEDPETDTQVLGATSHQADGSFLVTPPLSLGDVRIDRMLVTFGDFNVFRVWDLMDAPALVVGMDVLGRVDAMMIDYRRSEVRLLPKGDNTQMLIPIGGTATRFPDN